MLSALESWAGSVLQLAGSGRRLGSWAASSSLPVGGQDTGLRLWDEARWALCEVISLREGR